MWVGSCLYGIVFTCQRTVSESEDVSLSLGHFLVAIEMCDRATVLRFIYANREREAR